MTRFKVLAREDMTDEQKGAFDYVQEKEGRVRGGPWTAYVHRPELMRLQEDLSYYQRHGCTLTERERQVAVLAVCRHWDAEYPWAVQVRRSLLVGLEQAIVDAIAAGKRPALTDPGETAAYDVAVELMTRHRLSDATYANAEKLFGLPKLVDLVGAVGFFSMVACTANGFDITPPESAPARLPKR
jgi:4-carboxymuconolactone decarboxylase